MAKREKERKRRRKGGGRSEIEVRPRISFSLELQFEDVVAFVPSVYTRYAKGVRRGYPKGSERERERRGTRWKQGVVYLLTRSTYGRTF